MPAIYAHSRFGAHVLGQLPRETREILCACHGAFEVGLQGPDIFFHDRIFAKSEIRKLGGRIHKRSGREILNKLLQAPALRQGDKTAMSYLCGFICHFALDSACHGTVDAVMRETGFNHFRVEAELERRCMEEDGVDPQKTLPASKFVPGAELDETIAGFFPEITPEAAAGCVDAMKRNMNLLVPRNFFWRTLLLLLLSISGNHQSIYSMVVPRRAEPKLRNGMDRLMLSAQQAEKTAVRIIEELPAMLCGKRPDDPALTYAFSSELIPEKE